jgi:hypothetical protein
VRQEGGEEEEEERGKEEYLTKDLIQLLLSISEIVMLLWTQSHSDSSGSRIG